MLSTRDVQAANVVLIKDTIAKTGYDLSSKQELAEEDVAKLSPDDAQLLAGEMNKWSVNHNRTDLLVPAFSTQQFSAAAAAVKKQVAAKAQANAERSELAVFEDEAAEGADAGALIEARAPQFWHFYWTLVVTARILLSWL
ncbi:hypothetical protein M409DRAFT_57312 [Zasmidium cellare ATCC 36951]|uniref:Uncharacterized protein n=1 Tax=Zasmidium cellare ATCC 36951 TaxID=1080233 RepID=A0A6A6C994_ZASCE|nr:uncharacterized protein M409DRAFT_57312 [Zasmidium cellare ATCC 36951]KAF2163403.1 hypothetical protein M409DRAFT_57312 [Zasmidium cellare ATCC 36951]